MFCDTRVSKCDTGASKVAKSRAAVRGRVLALRGGVPRRLSSAYRPRKPTETVLYRVLQEHLPRFVEQVEDAGRPVPGFVYRELEGLLTCGRLEFGFVRQLCRACAFERLIGLPCAGRGLCPSCTGRTMLAGAARLVDHILPPVPVRQFVLSLPVPLRFVLAYDPDLCSRVLGRFLAEVFRWQRWTAKRELGLRSVADAHGGAFTAIHRSGSSLNLNLHYHAGVLDGVYVTPSGANGKGPEFRALPPPTRDDLMEISSRVYHLTRQLFVRLGRDGERPETTEDNGELEEPLLVDCVLGVTSRRGSAGR